MGIRFLILADKGTKRSSDQLLKLDKVRLIKRAILTAMVIYHWNNLPSNVVKSLSLKVFKLRMDVLIKDTV